MSNLAVIGDSTSVLGFRPLGIDTFVFADADSLALSLADILAGNYAVIFITEPLYEGVAEILDESKAATTPAVLPIPGVAGPTGAGRRELDKLIETAVGAAIKR